MVSADKYHDVVRPVVVEYAGGVDKLLATVVLRCEAQRELIPQQGLSRLDLELIRYDTNRIFTKFYAGVDQLQRKFSKDLEL